MNAAILVIYFNWKFISYGKTMWKNNEREAFKPHNARSQYNEYIYIPQTPGKLVKIIH